MTFLWRKIMKYKRIMILAIIFICLLAVSAVSATENVTSDVVSVEETTADDISVDKVVIDEDNQITAL